MEKWTFEIFNLFENDKRIYIMEKQATMNLNVDVNFMTKQLAFWFI